MQSKASAVWQGGLKDGKGEVSASSGVLSHTPYSFATRFEGQKGTNPEEMIAAAHESAGARRCLARERACTGGGSTTRAGRCSADRARSTG